MDASVPPKTTKTEEHLVRNKRIVGPTKALSMCYLLDYL